MKNFNYKNNSAFTLIELILTMIIIMSMVVCVAFLMLKAMDSYSLIVDRREALQKARLAVNLMENELATIATPATGVTACSATTVTFVPQGGGSVTYQITPPNLLRGSNILANGITANSAFSCLTTNGVVTANPALVHRIHITIEVDTGVSANGVAQINSNVYLRNRYYTGFIRN